MFHKCAIKFIKYSPRMRGSTYGGVSGCRYANISLHMQGSTRSCVASFDHRNIPRERGGHPTEQRLGTKYTIFPANAGVNLRWHVRVQVCEHSPCVSRDAPFSQILGISPSDYPLRWQGCSDAHLIQTIYCVLNSPYAGLALRNRCRFRRITPFLCFRRVGSSVRKKDAQLGRDLPCIGRGLSIGNKYTNSPRIDGVEPKTKTASTEELPCASGGVQSGLHLPQQSLHMRGKSTKAR